MKMNEVKIEEIAKKAQRVETRLWKLEREWTELKEKMLRNGTWVDYCKRNGYSEIHTFNDCLA
jgi:hypothetical protein